VKLAVISLSQVINDLAEAINRLGSDAELRGRLGAAARERIRSNFNWEKKGDTVASIYQSLKIPAVHH
jgi:glycosyltransferase involved in cell wall biosynthesis